MMAKTMIIMFFIYPLYYTDSVGQIWLTIFIKNIKLL